MSWYPGVRLSREGEPWVAGDLFLLRNPSLLTTFDQYEGTGEYRRVPTTAVTPEGERLRCWVYEFIGGVMDSQRVPSGDWLA